MKRVVLGVLAAVSLAGCGHHGEVDQPYYTYDSHHHRVIHHHYVHVHHTHVVHHHVHH